MTVIDSSRIEAGWWRCWYPAYRGKRHERWHYFDADQRRSRCGIAAAYARDPDSFNHIEQISGYALSLAPLCRKCDIHRRVEEAR